MRKKRNKNIKAEKKVFIIIGSLYAIGEILQKINFIPNWIRWHLSDVGFPIIFAYVLNYLFKIKFKYTLLISYIFCLCFEYLLQSKGKIEDIDKLDILAYTLGVILGYLALKYFRKKE